MHQDSRVESESVFSEASAEMADFDEADTTPSKQPHSDAPDTVPEKAMTTIAEVCYTAL